MLSSKEIIAKTQKYGTNNYQPKEVVIVKGEGAIAYDPEGREYFDMLSAYSALNFGHCHPELVATAKAQIETLTLTSRAFHNAILGDFCERLPSSRARTRFFP